jgi:hypothetical protein
MARNIAQLENLPLISETAYIEYKVYLSIGTNPIWHDQEKKTALAKPNWCDTLGVGHCVVCSVTVLGLISRR